MNWLLLVGISAVTNSFTRILQKILLVTETKDSVAFGFIFQLIVSMIMLVWALFTGFNIPSLSGAWINLILMSLLYSLGNFFTFEAFKLAEVSEASVIFASGTMWSVLSSMLFLHEEFTITKLIATSLVVIGVSVIYYSRSKWRLNRGHLYALLAAIFFGVAFVNDAFIIRRFDNIPSYMFVAFLIPALNILLFRPKSFYKLESYIRPKVLGKILLASIFYGISAVTIFQAYKSGGEASVISPISQASVIITVFIGYVFLKERDNLLNKITGTILVFTGAWLLS